MKNKEIKELHKLILDWSITHNLSTYELLAYLSATFVGTMAMANYSEEFVKRTLDRLLEEFRSIKRDT